MINPTKSVVVVATASAILCVAFAALAQGAPDPTAIAARAAKETRQVELLGPPPAVGSLAEHEELEQLHRIVADASPERLAQARADDVLEDPTLFNETMGVDLKSLPLTMAFLTYSIDDGRALVLAAKSHFHRLRPWAVDPTLPNCDSGRDKQKDDSYPSGHASLGYGVGMVLARLAPEHAAAVLTRARDYAYSRLVCGKHFASDVEASHVIASAQTERLFDNPALQTRIAAVRTELRAAHVITH